VFEATVAVGVDTVKLEAGVNPAVVIGLVTGLVAPPVVVDAPDEFNEPPADAADTKLNRSFTT